MNNKSSNNWLAILKQVITLSNSSTKAYKVAMFMLLLLNITYSFSLMQAVAENGLRVYQIIVLRVVIDSSLFLFFCHYFIRSYLKLSSVAIGLTLKRILVLCGYLLVVSILYGLVTYAISKIDYLSYSRVEGIEHLKEMIGEAIPSWTLATIFVINSFLMFVGWSVVYLFWQGMQSRKVMQKQMHQAQLQQLTNQLSPHFLFNSLNSIRALIFEDQEKAAHSVTLLSELFRTHLQAHLKPKSPLEQELEVTQRYLALEQIRLEERLSVEIDIEPGLTTQKIPTLTLLTLVENSIKHGISASAKNGFIQISAHSVSGTRWQLRISNSCFGCTEQDGTKTGLVNVKQRLEFMFGTLCELEQRLENEVFSIKMELPIA